MTFDMKNANDLLYRASENKITSVPGQTGYGCDHNKYREFQAMIEICSITFPAALEEIRRLEAVVEEMREAMG